jgi:N-acetylglucosamine kinase-like BadF-type ATPase
MAPVFLCFDGGGSKSRMILVDDDFTLLGEGRSLGVNTNHTPLAEVVANMRDCLHQALGGRTISHIDDAIVTIVGPLHELAAVLAPYGCAIKQLDEPTAALWAGALRSEGFVALSGTGSDAFYVGRDDQSKRSLGGWGLLLGDEGSGAWIGQQALRAIVHEYAGSGPPTLLSERGRASLDLTGIWQVVRAIYAAPSYVRYMAAFVPEVARAAREGDEIALSLFTEAGRHMAQLLTTLYEKTPAPEADRFCVLSGGAWKAHPAFFQTFAERMKASVPALHIHWPYFEPVMAGVSRALALRHPDWAEARRLAFLAERFPAFRVARPDDAGA